MDTAGPAHVAGTHRYEKEEENKNEEVRNVRINYIKMRNKMKKLGHMLKEKEKLTVPPPPPPSQRGQNF